MLLRFEVANHRSIMGPVALSMVAVDEDRPAARAFGRLTERVLTLAGIYGPNASGKSNVLDALAWFSSAVRRSLREWDEGIPRDPFKFGSGPTSPSHYELDAVVEGVRYTYQVVLNDSEIQFEGLYSYPERRRRILFEREGMSLHFRRGLGSLSGTRELLTPTTLVLSAATRLRVPEVLSFGHYLMSVGVRGLQRPPIHPIREASTFRLFAQMDFLQPSLFGDEDDSFRDRSAALALLRLADLGINDVTVTEEVSDAVASGSGEGRRHPRRRLAFVHTVADEHVMFEMEQESAGTRAWFSLLGPTLYALREGTILLFDEVDRSVHPRLSARLLELFQDPQTNPRGAQLIFTSHDTSLLNHMNRDEIWLTEKGKDAATALTALAEYGGDRVRRSSNLEKAYLQGRFGAIPELDQFLVRKALGLIQEADDG